MLNQPIKPMLLHPLQPKDIKSAWKSSLKWDGFRILIHYDHGNVRAFTRHGTEVTSSFPELSTINLSVKTAIFDGECIAFDLSQKASQTPKIWWDDAMTRLSAKKKSTVLELSRSLKAHFPLWDIIMLDDSPLLNKTFLKRRELLNELVNNNGEISVTPIYDDGAALFSRAKELGLEGIVQYNPQGKYHLDKRPKDVIVKVKDYKFAECQICSVRKGKFGWGLKLDGQYVGTIEFPPSVEAKRDMFSLLKKLTIGEDKDWIFLQPLMTCKVKYQCKTKNGMLRSPKFEKWII